MTTAKQIFNECLSANALVNSSLYFEKGGKVVRFADHKANPLNFTSFNDSATDIYLVYVNAGLSELEIQENVLAIEKTTGANVDYTFFEEGDDIEMIKALVDRFLN